MKQFKLPVELEQLEEGGYLAVCPLLQGCHAEGDTIAQALENLEDVAHHLIEIRQEEGLPIPVEMKKAGTVKLKAELLVNVP